MAESDLLVVREEGLFCPAGGFFIDPSRGVDQALVTHAHSDHARGGSKSYLTASRGVGLLQSRLGGRARIQGVPYGQTLRIRDVQVSFHPSGHMLGSAQIRVEHRGQTWVVSGDYKVHADATCEALEPVRCHTFITESTFGLPVFRWPDPDFVAGQIRTWWADNAAAGCLSRISAYSIGKAQRVLSLLDGGPGPILLHRAILDALPCYAAEGILLPQATELTPQSLRDSGGRALVMSPPTAQDRPWTEAGIPCAHGAASGWMLIRSNRPRTPMDRGFILSDHADWDGLMQTIRATGAEQVLVTHGYQGALSRWLRESGLRSSVLGPDGPQAAPPEGESVAT